MRISTNGHAWIETGDDPCHQTTFNFLFPIIELGKVDHDWASEEHITWSLRLDSKIFFRRYPDGKFWSFVCEVAGFGLEVAKQRGY